LFLELKLEGGFGFGFGFTSPFSGREGLDPLGTHVCRVGNLDLLPLLLSPPSFLGWKLIFSDINNNPPPPLLLLVSTTTKYTLTY
jgi:hypothetical protein